MSLRAKLAALFKDGVTEDEIRAELAEARAESVISGYQSTGLLSADADTVAAARALLGVNAKALDVILRAPRPAPAVAETIKPPTGPAPADPDPIAAYAAEHGLDYVAAAAQFEQPEVAS